MKRKNSIALRWSITALLCANALACASTYTVAPRAQPSSLMSEDPPAKPGVPTLLIAMPDSHDFVSARNSLVAEVRKDFNVSTMAIMPGTTVADLAAAIDRASPVCLVLMNNTSLALFRKYQANSSGRTVPPAVVLMTSFLEEASSHVSRVTGIAYEVPGVTGFVHLRMVLASPINRIGVIYRPAFGRFVERQTVLARREGVELVPMAVPTDVGDYQLRSALHQLIASGRIDALWVLNDNALIRDNAFIERTWREALRDVNVPMLVGVPNLVDSTDPFGTMAVVPDHEALGLQAANLIFELADDNWDTSKHPIELPLSVKTIVDIKQAREHFKLRPEALQHVDRALGN